MFTLTWCIVDINRLVDDMDDLKENAMWYINHFPNTAWNYEDIQNAGFNVLDIVEGCLCDSCICEDDSGNVVIFAIMLIVMVTFITYLTMVIYV